MAQQELGGYNNESETVCQTDLRKVQDYQAPWQGHGDLLQKQEPQAKTGLSLANFAIVGKISCQTAKEVV